MSFSINMNYSVSFAYIVSLCVVFMTQFILMKIETFDTRARESDKSIEYFLTGMDKWKPFDRMK